MSSFRKVGLVSILILTILSLGCTPPNEHVDLVVSSFTIGESENVYNFYTNDLNDYGLKFTMLVEDSLQDPFSSIDISVQKKSGYIYGDYGLIFCATEENYLALLALGEKKSVIASAVGISRTTLYSYLNQG